MKTTINTEKAPQVSGAMPTTNMGISDNADDQLMILNVLSNTLYTDKVAAVLREYGCNAADANVEAGKADQPIEVRLPNRLDPTVSIRDFGYGMTEDQILNVFCRLGRSTKRNSNAFTGMLGIGSKAGFAYGDHFLVTSWTGGVKVVYNAYRDQGCPKLAKMHEEPSDAPDGIEVKVPVRNEDMSEFITKAERVFRYFKVRPIIHGAKVEWDDRAQEYAGTGWRFTGGGHSVAIMGNVGYDLNASAMGFSGSRGYYGGGTPDPAECLIGLGVELDFQIGDLEIAANREGLQYKDLTKTAIKQRLAVAATEIGKVFTGKISGATCLWEARRYYHENFERLRSSGYYSLNQVVSGKIMWNGQVIGSGQFPLENKEKTLGVGISRIGRSGHTRGGTMIGIRNYYHPSSIEPDDAVTLVINDLPSKKQSPARMRQWFTQNPDCRDIIVFTFDDKKAQDTYWKNRELEGAPTTLMSSIPPLCSVSSGGSPGQKNSKHSAKVFVLDETCIASDFSAKSTWWKSEPVDVKNDAGVFVEIDTFAVQGVGGGEHPSNFLVKVGKLRKAGLITGPVYGFKRDKVPKLGKKWVRLEKSIADTLDGLIAKKNFGQELADSLAAQAFNDLIDEKHRASFPAGSKMREHLDDMYRMRNPKASQDLLRLVYRADAEVSPWLVTPGLPDSSVDLDTQLETVIQTYPMLKFIPSHDRPVSNTAGLAAVVNYVTLIGK